MKKLLLLTYALLFIQYAILAQETIHAYPTHWWAGMKNPKLQLMIRSEDIGNMVASLNHPGVKLVQANSVENKNYLFLDLVISPAARPGKMTIHFKKKNNTGLDLIYELLPRRNGNGTVYAQGVRSDDFIYMLMPDRFSNGDPLNDRIPGMLDQSLNRDSIFLRHGGDMQGIINHLDYLKNLGATTLWMTPVIENDMPNRTEHGYAFTDHYKIEPRIGGADQYKKLSDELHKRGMKLIQDAVYNHIGSHHFFMTDPPMKDWFHQWPAFTQTSYRDQPLMDPYASAIDKKITADGWFTTQMPDLNQSNPFVANFLIQHAIWCVEEFGVDGWRIDTYIYCDLPFMNKCNAALIAEYPKITMFGEAWVHGTANEAYFAENNINTPFKSNLQGITDFQCNFYGIVPALNQDFGWTDGVSKLYTTLSNDFLYKDPSRNVIFLDNHDMSRFLSVVKDDVGKLKMGLAWLLTSRGIPQIYYGTEVLMKGLANPDGNVRLDFPGGWEGDKKNAFTGEGLTAEEKAMQEYVRVLGNFRLHNSAIRTGKMMQYLPKDGLYVYFRYKEKQTVMCVMNTSATEKQIDFSNYMERTNGFNTAMNIETNEKLNVQEKKTIPARTMWVLELKK